MDGEETWENANGLLTHSILHLSDGPGESLLTIEHPDGTSTEMAYADRALSWQKDISANGQVIRSATFQPDSLLRPQSSSDAFGTTSNELLKNGLLNKTTLPDGRTIDITDRDVKTYLPTDITRADGKTMHQDIDAHGQIAAQIGAGVIPAIFGHSAQNGALTSLTTYGSTSASTTWDYTGPTGLLTAKTYAGGDTISYGYNAQLQLAEINRSGSDEIRSYDPNTGDWTDRNFNNGALEYEVNSRDIFGRIDTLTQWIGNDSFTTDYHYTAQNQLQSESLPQFTGSAFNTFYEYYGTGETTGAASPNATKSVAIRAGAQDAVKESYSYDEEGKRLHSIATASGTFTYDYFPGTDLIRSVTAPNGQITTYSYEPNTGRLSTVNSTAGSQTIYSIDFGYNDNDQRALADILAADTTGSLSSEQWDFDYDAQDQLIFAHSYHNDQAASQFDYSFDTVGNHTEPGWTVNIANQVTHIPGLNATLDYDARGNVNYDGHFHYTWDAADHLIKAENTVAKFEFGYDPQGRRTWKKSYGKVDGAWTLAQHLIFAYDGWNLLAEYTAPLVGNAAPTLYRSYAWGQSLGGGIGGLLSITDHSDPAHPHTYYPFYDGNGNIMGLTDSTGQVAATYRYDPFGKLLASNGPAADINPFRFSTKYYDSDTQLYYFGYRYYSPEMQRWMSRDPIEEDGGLNVYAFVGNDPVNQVDPVGLKQGEIEEISGSRRFIQYPYTGAIGWALRTGVEGQAPTPRVFDVIMWEGRAYDPARRMFFNNEDGRKELAVWRATYAENGRPWSDSFSVKAAGILETEGILQLTLPGFMEVPEATDFFQREATAWRPQTWEHFFPVWGSFRSAVREWQLGNYGSCAGDVAWAGSDILMVAGSLTAGARLLLRFTSKKAVETAAEQVARQSTLESMAKRLEKVADDTKHSRFWTERGGGAYKDIESLGGEVNHAPVKFASPLTEGEGPAFRMRAWDHRELLSTKGGVAGRAFRAAQAKLVKAGRFWDAMQMEIDHVHDLYGTMYDEFIEQMIEYAKTIDPSKLLPKK